MNLRDILRAEVPSFDRVDVAPLMAAGQVLGWESSLTTSDGFVLGGAVSENQDLAIQIAFAETLERALVLKFRSSQSDELQTLSYPTSCGFALGFDLAGAKQRSYCEALERWAWSKWIDEHFLIEKLSAKEVALSPLGKYFADHFEEVLFFTRAFQGREMNPHPLQLSISVGISGGGAFAGSRVSAADDSVRWTHALSESWRHLLRFRHQVSQNKENLVDKRLNYFGKNAGEALKQIALAGREDWPEPKTYFSRQAPTSIAGIYLYRTIMSDYLSWHLGGESRFVY